MKKVTAILLSAVMMICLFSGCVGQTSRDYIRRLSLSESEQTLVDMAEPDGEDTYFFEFRANGMKSVELSSAVYKNGKRIEKASFGTLTLMDENGVSVGEGRLALRLSEEDLMLGLAKDGRSTRTFWDFGRADLQLDYPQNGTSVSDGERAVELGRPIVLMALYGDESRVPGLVPESVEKHEETLKDIAYAYIVYVTFR